MSSSDEATSPAPCAGCKHLRRRCVPSCAFAAYFPPEHGDQFAAVHKVFGASNVSKLLAEVAPGDRAGAVESLVYEARARLRDPAFGCVSYITVLEHMLKQGMVDVATARGQLAAFRPFEPVRASPEARRVGSARLDDALRFAKEQDEKMRAVRVALGAKRKDAVKRGQGQALLNRQMAEAQQAAAVAQSAREQAMKMQQHAGTGQGFPAGHPRQQMAEAEKMSATASWEKHEMKMQGVRADEVYASVHYASMGCEHPNSRQRTALQTVHAQQVAAAEDIAWEPEMMLRQAAAAELTGDQSMLALMQQDDAELTGDQNVMMMMMQQVMGGHGHQQMVPPQQLSAAAELVAREKQDLIMVQQQAAAYAHAVPRESVRRRDEHGVPRPAAAATADGGCAGVPSGLSSVPPLPPPSADSPRQQQNDGGDKSQSSDLKACTMPPWLADVPRRQQQNDGGDDDDGQLSDLTAYFSIPGSNLPPNGSG